MADHIFLGVGPSGHAKARTQSPSRSGLLRRLGREPLLHFAVAGGLLFLAARVHADATDHHRIVVGAAQVALIDQTWRLQNGSPPSAAMREFLVRKWIEEEVLYREGVARGLDRDDEIIRRRVVQKMQFLSQGLATPPAPAEADLRAYFQSHATAYRSAERVTFSHIFFSPDGRGDAAARASATTVMNTLSPRVARGPERGDAFADRYDYANLSPTDAARLFGRSPMASAVFSAPVGQWSGPYQSGFGWHLVRVESRAPSTLPPFDTVADRVRSDYLTDAAAEADRRAQNDLERRYTVVRADRGAGR